MEIKSKSVFCGGFYHEAGHAVLGGSEVVPDPHFNRISIFEQGDLDEHLLVEYGKRMIEGMPVFVDLPYPVSDASRNTLLRHGYYSTGEFRSSMALTGHNDELVRRDAGANAFAQDDSFSISIVDDNSLDTFLELFLRGFQTPEDLIPLAKSLFHDPVAGNCRADNSRLYLGLLDKLPAATLYLFFEEGEGGINMVSTREDLRKKGIATSVLLRAIADAQALGVHTLGLETRWDSAPERLYRKLGFTTIARHEVFTNMPDLKYGL
jgi:ribosomal protein S18 acetylase RimI-like enzyme